MTLVVFDRGARIETPAKSLFPPRRVEPNSASSAEPAVPDSDHHARAESEHLTQDYERFNELKKAHSQAAQAYKSVSVGPEEEPEPEIKASQIMVHPVVTTRRDTLLVDALKLMDEHSINHLMVTDDEGTPLGLISRIDILRHPLSSGAKVESAYRDQFLVASPDTDVRQIAANLITYHIGSVPVLSEDDELLGIITRTDLLKLVINNAQIEGWV